MISYKARCTNGVVEHESTIWVDRRLARMPYAQAGVIEHIDTIDVNGRYKRRRKTMKFRTTRKAIVEGSTNLVCAGYCDLVHLLNNHSPIAYTCGIYGWNFDVYDVYGVTICTGYRNMPGRRAQGIVEYESKARAILDDYSRYYKDRYNDVEKLLQEFCKLNGGD